MTRPINQEQFVSQAAALVIRGLDGTGTDHSLRGTVRQMAFLFNDMSHAARSPLTIRFSEDDVFVNGEVFRGSRQAYARAEELKASLASIHVNEVTFDPNLTPEDIGALLEALAHAPHDPTLRSGNVRPSERVRLRWVPSPIHDQLDAPDLDPAARVVRMCSAALVVLEHFHEGLKRGEFVGVRELKRLARSIVQLSLEHPRLLLGFASASGGRGDEAMRALKSSVLATVTFTLITPDRKNLGDLAMTALTIDSGLLRASRLWRHAERGEVRVMPRATDESRQRLPESTAFMNARFGGYNEASLARSVYGHEAHAVEQVESRGPLYSGEHVPTLEAVVLTTVRRYLELLADDPHGKQPGSVDIVFERMANEARAHIQQDALRLFVSALGIHVRGTPVLLSSGWRGVVLGNHSRPGLFARPVVRLVYDASGKRVDPARDVDLSDRADTIVALGCIAKQHDVSDHVLDAVARVILARDISPAEVSQAPFMLQGNPGQRVNRPPVAKLFEDSQPHPVIPAMDVHVPQGVPVAQVPEVFPMGPDDADDSPTSSTDSTSISDSLLLDSSSISASLTSDQVRMVNIDDIAHFMPGSAPGEAAPAAPVAASAPASPHVSAASDAGYDDEGEPTETTEIVDIGAGRDVPVELPTSSLEPGPGSWDSNLDGSDIIVLSGSFDAQDAVSPEVEPTAMIPSEAIAQIMFMDRQRDDLSEVEDDAPEDP